MAAGLAVLCVVGARRLRRPTPIALSLVTAAVVAATFVFVYSADLIALL